MSEQSSLPRVPLLAISFVQGLLLYALFRAFDNNLWPSESPLWSFPLWTLVIAVPLLLLLTIDRSNYVNTIKLVAGFGVILALLATYTGWQAEPYGAFSVESLAVVYALSAALACFKALMYIQQRADGIPLSYQVLFTNSWRNFLVAALSAVFTLIFWLILVLWAQLFRVIEIDFFYELFQEEWFIIPALTFAFGLGTSLFRDLKQVIDNITKLLHWLIKLLLPLVIVVAVVFLGALPFVGLDLLWSTGNGTALLLWLLALLLFFTNAVYQDGRETNPYPALIHRLIYAGLCVMPIVSALSFYGLYLRLAQYGWTVERSWAFVVWLILSLFAIGYVVGIIRRRSNWTNELARVNTGMGLVVLALMLLANSPLLDFRKISLASQLGRVDSGEIQLQQFDFWYTKQQLARPGYLAVEKMKGEIGDSDPDLLATMNDPTPVSRARRLQDIDEIWATMRYRPDTFEVPPELKQIISNQLATTPRGDPLLVRADLDNDAQDEYLIIVVHRRGIGYAQLFHLTDGSWQHENLSHSAWRHNGGDLREKLEQGDIEVVEPRFKDVRIGDLLFQPMQMD